MRASGGYRLIIIGEGTLAKFASAFVIVFVCSGLGSAQTGRRATAKEKGDLLQLIKQDDEVVEFLAGDPSKGDGLVKSLDVSKVDLNGDGRPEYVVVLGEDGICGALGNCPQWIYRKNGARYELLLRTRARSIVLEKSSTRGYRDLRASSGDTAIRDEYEVIKYDGRRYRATDCFTRDFSGKRVKVTRVRCGDDD